MYLCYLIYNKSRTYIGSTNNFTRRIRQHNCEISGGAKYTTNFKTSIDWYPVILISGFKEKKNALSFEWRIKRSLNKQGKLKPNSGLDNRVKNIFDIISSNKITNNCPPVSSFNLSIWINNDIEEKIDTTILDSLPENIKIDFFNNDKYKEIELMINNEPNTI